MPEDALDFSDIGTKISTETQSDPLDFSDLGKPVTGTGLEQPTVEEFGGSEFSRGVARNRLQAAAGLASFVDLIGADKSGIFKDIADQAMREASMIPTKAGSIKDVLRDPSLAPAYVGRVLGELAPQAVESYLLGRLGGAAGAALGFGRKGIRVATGVGAATTSVPQEVGHIYQETGSKSAAMTYGIPAGALDALSAERIVSKVFNVASEEGKRRAWRQVVRESVMNIPKSAGVESVTEAAQESLALLANKSADNTYSLLNKDNGWRVLEAAVAGAIGGGAFGGVTSVSSLPMEKAARGKRAEELRLIRQFRDNLSGLQEEEAPPPQPEPSESDLEYGGGEMPRTPAVWEQTDYQRPRRLTRGIGGGEMPPTGAVQFEGQEFDTTPQPRTRGTGGGEMPATSAVQFEGQEFEQAPTGPAPARVVVAQQETGEEPIRYVSIQADNNQRSGAPEYWRGLGFSVPDFSQLPPGTYTFPEASMMAVMTPDELQDYLTKRKPAPDKQPAPPPVPVQAQPPVIEAPEGFALVRDLSVTGAGESPFLAQHKIQLQYDPGKKVAGEVKLVDAFIVISPRKLKGQLVVQARTSSGKELRNIWSAPVNDLIQAGVLVSRQIGGYTAYQFDEGRLFRSPLLVKSTDRHFKPYKLPGQSMERSQGVDLTDLVAESHKVSPFFGVVMETLVDSGMTFNQIKGLASKKTGGAVYAAKDAKSLTQQLYDFVNRSINQDVQQAQRNGIDKMTDSQKQLLIKAVGAREKMSEGVEFTREDAQDFATSYVLNLKNVVESGKPREEVFIEDIIGGGEDSETGVEIEPGDVGARWDTARTESILGQIENINPKLYQMFTADPENNKAWEAIEQELVKFFEGKSQNPSLDAEMLTEAIWQERAKGWMAMPGRGIQIANDAEEVNWLTGISATGKDGIVSLLNNRRIQLDPQLRRIGLALLNRIPAKYLDGLTFNVDKTGISGGEFIPWMKTAQIAMNSTDPTVAAHEISHYLAQFLTSKERGEVAAARAAEVALAKADQANKEFFAWLDSNGGSAISAEYTKWKYGTEIDPRIVASPGTPFRFATSTEIALRTAKPFGLQPDKNGFIPKQSLLAKMRGQVSKEELGVLLPILNPIPERVNAQMLANRIQEQGPQLEVVKLKAGGGNASEAKQRLAQLTHHGDTMGYNWEYQGETINLQDENGDFLVPRNEEEEKFITELNEVYALAIEETANDSATFNYQFVNPKPLKDMPGAVDILVRIPYDRVPQGRGRKFDQSPHGHFGTSDVNIVGWVRAYIETLPSGEKVFHVFEVQSDWAQQVRNLKEDKDRPDVEEWSRPSEILKRLSDPLLAYYESAALKAAIRHARELGITKVAISDAETAMMTEGHDRQARIDYEQSFPTREAADAFQVSQNFSAGELVNRGSEYVWRVSSRAANPEEMIRRGFKIVEYRPPQEPGMRLHYDQTLPNIMHKLTGKAPVVVDFGVHQNVLETRTDTPIVIEYDRVVQPTRKDLLFGGKTSITARVFDISGVNTDIPAQMYRSSLYSVTDPLYHLINDDEFFAHYMSEAAAKAPAQIEGFFGKVREIIRRIFEAMKEWVGIHPTYWDLLIQKFERGEFLVHENGGMLFDENNRTGAKSLPPISSLPALRQFTRVDQGQDEAAMVRNLTYEQNQPIVGHVRELFGALPRRVRAELPGIASRLAALLEVTRDPRRIVPSGQTPLKHYATIVSGLGVREEARKLGDEIHRITEEIKKQVQKGDRTGVAEIRAAELQRIINEQVSDYKNHLIKEKNAARDDGVAEGLGRAIEELDKIQGSATALESAVAFMAATMSLEELNGLSTAQVVERFQQKIMAESGSATWQEATIPAAGGRPAIRGIRDLRMAVNIMKARQNLVQDIISYKEVSDPEFARIMKSGLADWDNDIQSMEYKNLRQFLSSYYSVRSAKDKARKVYLDHGLKLRNLFSRLDTKLAAEEFLHSQVLNSVQFTKAMADAAKQGFMSAEIVRDNSGADVLKRTYYNPLNMEQSVNVVDGTTREDFEKNVLAYEQVMNWYDQALDDPRLDELTREAILFEQGRIHDFEVNEKGLGNAAYDPSTGKRVHGPMNLPNILGNLTGNTLQWTMNKIGGRAAVQYAAAFQVRSEARRRVAEVRHELTPELNRAFLNATRGHEMPRARWITEVAEPILASYNSIGSKLIKAGDITVYGHRVSGADMEAVRQMKKFSDAIIKATANLDLQTAKLHPIKIREVLSGKEILRNQQGLTELVMPRRFYKPFLALIEGWQRIKNNRKAVDASPDLLQYVQSGEPFEKMVLAHIYSTQRYPDYANTTRFGKAYREIYGMIINGNPPTNFNQVVDIVFQSQSGLPLAQQITKEEIAREILVKELDKMANLIDEQIARDRAAYTPGTSVKIESADNFLTKARGQMIAPEGGYQYTISDNGDIKWLVHSALEVHEQIARDGLEKIQKMLQEYIAQWEDRLKHPSPQNESVARQLSGEDWLNYREAKQMLNQVNSHLEKTSPSSFKTFIDEQFGGIMRKAWSTLIQSLLQSATVLKNNVLGMDIRLLQMESQWRGDGVWAGMPKWLLKLPTVARHGIAMPISDTVSYLTMYGRNYRKAVKGVKVKDKSGRDLVGQDALRAVMEDPQLVAVAASQVGGEALRRAVLVQKARDLGAAGPYGIDNQVKRYLGQMFLFGGDIEHVDPTTVEKIKGGAASLLGLFQETGFGLILPKAIAPRKVEQFLNFLAIRHGQRLIDELTMNLRESIADRKALGVGDVPLTDAELLGDPKAKQGEATYMRRILSNAGLNMDAIVERLKNNPTRDLLTSAEWNSFVLEVAKELNMPAADNRVQYKSGFARLMSSLMPYGMWYNERLADTLARSSNKKFDPSSIYRGMFFVGVIMAMGIFTGTPIQRLLKKLLYDEEEQIGHFSSDNTAWRNAGVLWEQTSMFWPIIGSVMSQLYDARAGGGKFFNFLPVSAAQQALRTANEIGATGDVFYPMTKLLRAWFPNTKIWVNRLPQTEGLTEVSNAGRTLRSVAGGDVEVRSQKGGGQIKYSPITTQVQMAVNELAKANPDYMMINQYRDDAVKVLVKKGASRKDAERRFDLSVLARYPENTVFGRPLTPEEKSQQGARMTPAQTERLSQVGSSFDRYASTFGLRAPSQVRRPRLASSRGKSLRLTRSRRTRSARLRRNRSLTRRGSRRLVRG